MKNNQNAIGWGLSLGFRLIVLVVLAGVITFYTDIPKDYAGMIAFALAFLPKTLAKIFWIIFQKWG